MGIDPLALPPYRNSLLQSLFVDKISLLCLGASLHSIVAVLAIRPFGHLAFFFPFPKSKSFSLSRYFMYQGSSSRTPLPTFAYVFFSVFFSLLERNLKAYRRTERRCNALTPPALQYSFNWSLSSSVLPFPSFRSLGNTFPQISRALLISVLGCSLCWFLEWFRRGLREPVRARRTLSGSRAFISAVLHSGVFFDVWIF